MGLIGIWPLASYGATFVAQEEEAATTTDINDDLYMTGNSVMIDNKVRDDVFSAANSVDITGEIGQDVYAGGNSVRITSEVGDDIIAAGNTVRIMPKRVDDIIAAGNAVDIVSDNIEGSVYVVGQRVTIEGQVKGSVKVTGDIVRIKSGSKISGDLITYGQKEPVIESGVIISGETKHVLGGNKETAAKASQGLVLDWVMSVIVWFVAALALFYLLPALTNDVVKRALHNSGRSLGVGMIWILVLIPAIIALFVTVIGWPLAVLIMVSSATALAMAGPLSMVLTGMWVMQKIQKTEMVITWQHVLVGTVLIKIVQMVPVVGWFIALLVFILTLGAVGTSLWACLREKHVESSSTIDTTSAN